MKLPSDIPVSVLQSHARAADAFNVPLRLLLGVTWVESEWGGRSLLPSAAELAQSMARLKTELGSWERVLAGRYWGVRRAKEATQFPAGVLQYIERVHTAGQAARIPFMGPVWTIPAGGLAHA